MVINTSDSALTIRQSWRLTKKGAATVLRYGRVMFREHPVYQHRTDRDLLREWAVHKVLYRLHILRSRTGDVDLEWPQAWYYRVGYRVAGAICLLILR